MVDTWNKRKANPWDAENDKYGAACASNWDAAALVYLGTNNDKQVVDFNKCNLKVLLRG